MVRGNIVRHVLAHFEASLSSDSALLTICILAIDLVNSDGRVVNI